MLHIIYYKQEDDTHKKYLSILLSSQNMPERYLSDIPRVGIICTNENDEVIAAGFIRKIEGPYGMLDSYITNNNANSEDRDQALDLITAKLIQIAKDSSITKLISFSVVPNIVSRAKKHGFYLLENMSFLTLNLIS